MKEFKEIGHFIAHLTEMAAAETLALHDGLKKCAVAVERTAKAEIGHYQDEAGYFPGWVELAEATKADRLRQGYSENDPLLRSGDLRDSISHEIAWLDASIGSTSDIIVYQELGPNNILPVLGPAAIRNRELIEK